MSEILDEQLSAFLDGELPPEELDLALARLDRDPVRRARLGRYAMIGECLRTGLAHPGALPVAERVRSSLLNAPDAAAGAGATKRDGTWSARGLVAAVFAASLGVLVLLTSRSGLWQPPDQQQLASRDESGPARSDDGISTVTAAVSHRLDPQAAERLTGYLFAHGVYANKFSRSTFDSHLVTARAERAAWRQAQGPADVR